MIRIICNHCRTEVEPNHYGLAPIGWYRVSPRGPEPDSDYCSPACLVAQFTLIGVAVQQTAVAAAAPLSTDAASASVC